VRCALPVSDFYPVDGANGFVPNLIKQLCLLNFGDSIMTQFKKFLTALGILSAVILVFDFILLPLYLSGI
jgi:hypothetical protein